MSNNFVIVQTAQTITRPADTTAYATTDVITGTTPSALIFSSLTLRRLEYAYLTRASLATNNILHTTTTRLFLFNSLPVVQADNASFGLSANVIGFVDFPAHITSGAGLSVASFSEAVIAIPRPFQLVNGTIWGVLTTTAIFTPIASGTFNVTLTFEVSD